MEKTQKKTKELHSETLIRKLHFKGSWQIHGQPQGVFIRVFKRSGADLMTTVTSFLQLFRGCGLYWPLDP